MTHKLHFVRALVLGAIITVAPVAATNAWAGETGGKAGGAGETGGKAGGTGETGGKAGGARETLKPKAGN